jgi:hypothetical protein
VLPDRRHDLGTLEQSRALVRRRPVADVCVLEDLGERPAPLVLAQDVALEMLLAFRRPEQECKQSHCNLLRW